jgi:lactoylglutathione lyase
VILEHVGVTVTDLDRSIAFYTEVLGLRLLRRTATNAYLHLDEELLELMQATDGAQANVMSRDTMQRMLTTVGPNHIGFRVDDLDVALEAIERRGGTVVTRPFDYTPAVEFVAETKSEKLRRASRPLHGSSWRIAVVADPDGTMLELLER